MPLEAVCLSMGFLLQALELVRLLSGPTLVLRHRLGHRSGGQSGDPLGPFGAAHPPGEVGAGGAGIR